MYDENKMQKNEMRKKTQSVRGRDKENEREREREKEKSVSFKSKKQMRRESQIEG